MDNKTNMHENNEILNEDNINDKIEDTNNEVNDINNNETNKTEKNSNNSKKEISEKDLKKIYDEITARKKEHDELQDKYLRMMAEYDNFRKRSAKEKENIYSDAVIDVLKIMLPVLDNLERATAFSEPEKVFDGLKMIFNQLNDSLSKLGVEEIKALDESFNPEFHSAVMHEEDPEKPENTIVQVLQKGYIRGDKIIRASTVKVVN